MTFSEMKKWAMDHLKKQMKDEPKESETFKKSIDMLFNMIQKSRGLPVGTIREWKGNKYKKMPNNHWVRVYDKSSRGANHAIAAVLRKIETCQDETELYNIIQANIGRFSDANGIPLPEVEKIHKASDEKKGKFGSGEKNESEKTTIVSQEELRSLSDKLLNKRFKELGEIIPTLKDDKVRREYNENYKNFQKEIERREAESEKKESERNVSTKFKTGDIVTIRSKAKTPNLKVLGSHEADGEIWIETENPETGYKANYNEIYLTKQLKKEENTTIKTPSSEKHQNRSDAMKGNQNAYKGLNLSEETKKDIEEFRPLFDKIQKMISDSKYSAWQVRSGKQLLEKVNSELESLEDEAKESKTDKSSEIKKTKELIEDIKKYEESPLTDILAGFSLVDSYEEIAKKTDNKRYYEIAENELKDAQKNIDNYEKSKSESKQSGKDKMNDLLELQKQKIQNLESIKKMYDDLNMQKQKVAEAQAKNNLEDASKWQKEVEKTTKDIDKAEVERAKIQQKGEQIVKDMDAEKEENNDKMNNPKSLEGIEFVNKNKMQALANYLANHDNINMASAVVRLKDAYDKLGEEKFLSRFPKEIVEKYRKESGNTTETK